RRRRRRRRRREQQRRAARRGARRTASCSLTVHDGSRGAPVTVGIDIGTSAVKAVAADAEGNVVADVRLPHEVRVPAPDRLEHDAALVWRERARDAPRGVAGLDVRGVRVAAMVPTLTAVDGAGVPLLPGLLYGDERGQPARPVVSAAAPGSGELLSFLRWAAAARPDAAGF